VGQTAGPAACSTVSTLASETDGYTYTQLASTYGLSSLYAEGDLGSEVKIALFELDPWAASDIAAFQSCYGTHTKVYSVEVDGGAGTGSGEGEAALDIESLIGLAPDSLIYAYDAPPDNYAKSTVDELSAIINKDNQNILSISYGLCEQYLQSNSPGLIASENTLYEEAATEGMTVLAASGDTGSEECERSDGGGSLAVLDPSAQPFVTSVGGTDLTSAGSPPAETVWNDNTGAGGGGISSVWPMPAWQSGPGVINSYSSGTPCGAATGYCRETPDVSASSSPYNGYVIYLDGGWFTQVGGTSAATPLWAATLADIESAAGGTKQGFLNPLLYSAAATGLPGFNDITVGDNDWTGDNGGLYPATADYDLASGLGSPIASGLSIAILGANTPIGFTDAPGTNAPPAHLGRYAVTKFTSTCTQGTTYTSTTGPTGALTYKPGLVCEKVGSGWETWSNGYTGDVYWNNSDIGSTTITTLTLPADTVAFYFYAEPAPYAAFDIVATAQNGTNSGPLQVEGDSGAAYYGFYAKGSSDIAQITIVSNTDYAIGEYGIAKS
jgi:subtilase family serine protease